MATPPDITPTSVYRYYDTFGVLIYVGITNAGILRNRQHNDDKPWWKFVAKQQVDHFPTRDAAHEHEIRLIQKYRPPFNIQFNIEHRDIRAAYLGAREAGVFEGMGTGLLPRELCRFHVEVADIDPSKGTAVLRTSPNHALATARLVHIDDVPVFACAGVRITKKLGSVRDIQKHGALARVHLGLLRGWRFTEAELWLKPIARKGDVPYVIKQVRALGCDTETWKTAEAAADTKQQPADG